jgi:hypothetical protein
MAIITGSFIALLFGITSGGVIHPWKSGAVIASIVAGACGTVVFAVYEEYGTNEPMIPLRIFKSRTAAAAFISTFVLGFVLWAMEYYFLLYV